MTPNSNLANQLFISYAHIDNRYFTGGDRGANRVTRVTGKRKMDCHASPKKDPARPNTAVVRVRPANAPSHQPAA